MYQAGRGAGEAGEAQGPTATCHARPRVSSNPEAQPWDQVPQKGAEDSP